jgi:hypothetical protein
LARLRTHGLEADAAELLAVARCEELDLDVRLEGVIPLERAAVEPSLDLVDRIRARTLRVEIRVQRLHKTHAS